MNSLPPNHASEMSHSVSFPSYFAYSVTTVAPAGSVVGMNRTKMDRLLPRVGYEPTRWGHDSHLTLTFLPGLPILRRSHVRVPVSRAPVGSCQRERQLLTDERQGQERTRCTQEGRELRIVRSQHVQLNVNWKPDKLFAFPSFPSSSTHAHFILSRRSHIARTSRLAASSRPRLWAVTRSRQVSAHVHGLSPGAGTAA